MKRRFCCSESRRSEVAVELVVEGEAEMQSRNTKGFITLIAVAALFFSVAVPQSFAQPEGDHNADKEIQHWQRVWVAEKEDKKGTWEEKYLDKFSEEDLKPEDDTTPNKKVTKWLEQLSDEDEAKQIEFLEKVYVKDAGDKKKETIQPYKLVQALKSVLVEKHDQVSRDDNVTDKKEAMASFVDSLFKRMSYKDGSSKFRKAIGTKGEAYDMLMDRIKAVLGEMSKEELEEMTEEELLEEIFTDEIKKALGLDASSEESEEEEEEEEEQDGEGDEDKDGVSKEDLAKLLEERDRAQAKKFEDMLKNLTIPTAPLANGIGEQITKGVEDLKNRVCAAQDRDNGIADLIDQFNDGIADLREAADLGDLEDDNDGLFDSLLASALGQGNRDQNRQLDQGEAVVPPQQQIPPFASQPSQADSGSDLPQTPQPLGPQPIPPRQLPQLVDTSIKDVETVGLQPVTGDPQQSLIDGTKAILANSRDESELGNLFGTFSNALTPFLSPIAQFSAAVAKKNDAINKFTQMKGLRDQHQRAASTIRGEIEEIEATEQQAFAKSNPAAALSLEDAKQQVENFEAQMKQIQQQASATNPDGSPQYADSDIQNRIAELQRLKSDQEKQVRLGEQLKGSFMASRNTKYKSLKRALQEHETLASQADTEAKRYAGEAKTAATEEQTLLLSQQQNTSSMIPTVNGFASVNGASQPFTRPNGTSIGSGLSGRRGFNNSLAGPSNGNAARGLLRGGAQ